MALDELQNFYKANTSQAWGTTTGTFYVTTLPTPSAGKLVINPSSSASREIIKYTSKGTDGTGNYIYVSERGVGNTDAVAHTQNEPIRMNLTAEHYADIQTELDAKLQSSYLDTDGTLAANSDVKVASQKATKTYSDTKVSKTGDETVAGIKTFSSSPVVPAPTTDLQAATKKYVDDTAFAGAPDASTTVKGVVEQATEAQVLAETETGETGAKLFISPKDIQAAVENFAPAPTLSSTLQTVSFLSEQSNSNNTRMTYSDDENAYVYNNSSVKLVLIKSGQMPQIRDVQTEYAASAIISVCSSGDYIYVLLRAAANKIFRYLKSDLTSSPTEITLSGQSLGTTSSFRMTIEGSTFYFTGKAGNSANLHVISKYTLSGTTLTYSSDVTCGSTSNDFSAGIAVVSTNIYGLNSSELIIVKFNSSGTEQAASGAFLPASLSVNPVDLFNWNGSLFVVQNTKSSSTNGDGAVIMAQRVYVS